MLNDKKLRLSEEKSLKTGGNRVFLRVPLRNGAVFRVGAGSARKLHVFKLKMLSESKTKRRPLFELTLISENIWDARASVRHAWLRPWPNIRALFSRNYMVFSVKCVISIFRVHCGTIKF